MHITLWRAIPCLLSLLLSTIPAANAAGVVKWVDERGNVNYSDRGVSDSSTKTPAAVPAPAAKSAIKGEPLQVAKQVDEVGPTKSPEEQKRRDRALLGSYTSETDIDRARDRTLSIIESELGLMRNAITKLQEQKRSIEDGRAGSATKSLPAARARELADIDAQLQSDDKFILQKHEQFNQAATRFDQDKRRWRELKSAGLAN